MTIDKRGMLRELEKQRVRIKRLQTLLDQYNQHSPDLRETDQIYSTLQLLIENQVKILEALKE